MKLLLIIAFAILSLTCLGQNKPLIPGLIPLALSKGGYEINLGANYDSYNKAHHPTGVTGIFQATYGVLSWMNVGLDVTAFSMRYTFEDASVLYDVHYRNIAVGPRLRWAIYNSKDGLFNITGQNSVLFPFSKIETTSSLGPEGQKNISNGPVFNNQVTFLFRTGYHIILTLDGYLVIYPTAFDDEKRPIDLPIRFLTTYALKTNWMIHGILSYVSEFRTIGWDSGSSYYRTGETLKAGVGLQYSLARGFSVNLAALFPIYSHAEVPSWSDSKNINLSFRWRP
jgi:hypothetical protein